MDPAVVIRPNNKQSQDPRQAEHGHDRGVQLAHPARLPHQDLRFTRLAPPPLGPFDRGLRRHAGLHVGDHPQASLAGDAGAVGVKFPQIVPF